jgi:hypothetical protein
MENIDLLTRGLRHFGKYRRAGWGLFCLGRNP